MGAIQGSINSMIGTATGALALGKYAMEQQDANMMKKAELNEKILGLQKEVSDLQYEAEGKLAEQPAYGTPSWDEALKAAEMGDEELGAINSVVGGNTTNLEITMFDRAMRSSSDAISAKQNQLNALKSTFDNVGKSMVQRVLGRKK